MKKKLSIALSLFLTIAVQIVAYSQQKSSSDVHVRSTITKNGTHVEEHYRTAPDGNKENNFSTKGNTNPYTEKAGHVSPNNKQNTKTVQNSGTYVQPTDFNINQDELMRKADAEMKRYEAYEALGKSQDRYEEASKKAMAAIRPLPEIPKIIDITAIENRAINYNNGYSYNDKLLLEKILLQLGYYAGVIDGIIDSETINAIKKFQRDNGLTADGCVGRETSTAIQRKFTAIPVSKK